MPGVNERFLRPPRDVARRPSGLKLMLRRQRKFLKPALWGLTGFAVVMLGILVVRSTQPGGTIARMRDAVASAADMRVQQILPEGIHNTPRDQLDAAIGVHAGQSMLSFSLASVRQRVEALSWVEHATVERRLPGTLVVNVVERRPYAIWQHEGKFVLIDREGQVVTGEDVVAFGDLPLVVGAGAPQAATGLLEALAAQPALKPRVLAAIRVGERRWNLRMKNGTDVLLPEGAEPQALAKLAELQAADQLLDRPLVVVDMRLPDRLVVRPQSPPPTAAAPAPGKKA